MKGFQESEPDKIMVIVEKHPKSKLPPLANNRCHFFYKGSSLSKISNSRRSRIWSRKGSEKEWKKASKERKVSLFLWMGQYRTWVNRSLFRRLDGSCIWKMQRKRWHSLYLVSRAREFLICPIEVINIFCALIST